MLNRAFMGLFLAASFLLLSCQKDKVTPYGKVKKIEDLSEAIGGPGSVAKLGDFILENDKIRFVVSGSGKGQSYGPGMFAGSIIDADLQRRDGMHRSGHGSDQISEFFPTVALGIANPENGGGIDIWNAGGSNEAAILVSYGKMENYLELLDILKEDIKYQGITANVDKILNQFSMPEWIVNIYKLDPGKSTLEITTLVHSRKDADNPKLKGAADFKAYLDSFKGNLDGLYKEYAKLGTLDDKMDVGQKKVCPAGKTTCKDEEKIPNPLGAFDLVFEGGSGGDFVFFGRKIDVFSPGYGYGYARGIQDLFFKDKSSNSISNPLPYSSLIGLGDEVSLSLFTISEDKKPSYLYVPLFESSISLYLSHGLSGAKKDLDKQFMRLKEFKRFRFTRYLAMGKGDAASALEPLYNMRGLKTAKISGRIYKSHSGQAVKEGQVLVICDPKDGKVYKDTNSLLKANRKKGVLIGLQCGETIKKEIITPKGKISLDSDGVISMLKVNAGYERVPSNKFEGRVPPGTYYLAPIAKGFNPGVPVKVKLEAGDHQKASLILKQNAELEVNVHDEKGQAIPFKLSVGYCFPEANKPSDCPDGQVYKIIYGRAQCVPPTCSQDSECDTDEVCNLSAKGGGRCECAVDGAKKLPGLFHESLKGPNIGFGVVKRKYFHTSPGYISVPEGDFDILISRGIEYDIVTDSVSLKAGTSTTKRYSLPRILDTEGWISADFHVHGIHSFDGNVSHANRVLSAMGENLEVITTTDHDAISDIGPHIREAGANRYVASQVGTEITSLEFGHFLSYPLTKNWNLSQGDPLDWNGKTPGRIFEEIKARKSPVENPMVAVAHPRDGLFGYFDQFSLHPLSMKIGEPGLLDEVMSMFKPQPCGDETCFGKVLNFCPDFEGMEIFNGIHMEILRWGTVKELRDFELKVKSLDPNKSYFDNFEDNMSSLRKIMARSKNEESLIPYLNRENLPRVCKADADCNKAPFKGKKFICVSGACTLNAQDEVADEDISSLSCDSSKDCPAGLLCLDQEGKKVCKMASCDKSQLASGEDALCVGSSGTRGVIDDWFYLLNHGIYKVAFGNSDTHTLKNEIGLPRNFIKAENDQTESFNQTSFHNSVMTGKVYTTYGPIVSVDINGKGMGETLDLSGQSAPKLKLNVKVDSALWFDVDRVEVYENGKLIRIACHKQSYEDGESCEDIIDSPNLSIENYSQSIDITPKKDSWYVVIAMGLHGKTLSPVYNDEKIASYQVSEILNRGIGGIQNPLLNTVIQIGAKSLLQPVAKYPRIFPVLPYALTNPIFVKVSKGKGFESLLGEAPFVRQVKAELAKGGVKGACHSKVFSDMTQQPFMLKLNNAMRHGGK